MTNNKTLLEILARLTAMQEQEKTMADAVRDAIHRLHNAIDEIRAMQSRQSRMDRDLEDLQHQVRDIATRIR